MKRFYRGRYLVGAVVCCALVFFAGRRLISCFTPSNYQFQFSGSFCRGQQAKIKDFVRDQVSGGVSSLQRLGKIVQKRFPSIETVRLAHHPSGVVQVDVQSAQPLFVINQDFVLTHNGSLFHSVLFAHESLKNLHQIMCSCLELYKDDMFLGDEQLDHADKLPDGFLQTAKKIPEHRFATHDIVCESKINWRLQDKEQKNFSILCTNETMADQQVLLSCNAIRGTLHARKKRSIQQWVADVRFANQIILSRKSGGR